MVTDDKYPDFIYPASKLSAYIASLGLFIISLKNSQIIHFSPEDVNAFEKWLKKHGIRDIGKDW